MIVIDGPKGTASQQSGPSAHIGSSNVAPPTFEESADHVVLDFSPQQIVRGIDESPPEFTPYEADFFKLKNGWIISHDPHLNQDGEALYRFLLSQALSPPIYLLRCKGTHDETHTRAIASTDSHGRVRRRSETYTETVTDFDFTIDVGRNIPVDSSPVHWSVPDSEPAYRGKMVREVEVVFNEAVVLGNARRKATKQEIKMFKAWKDERTERGLPPWAGSESRWHGHSNSAITDESGGLRSSMTLRNWADEYCASQKHLKEFTYEKVVHGWNIDTLKSAVRATITSTSYAGNISVSFEYASNKICVRPDNRLSRILSNPWLKFLMIITLIYPFVWLYKRFHVRGGGRWEVCGGAYSLKRFVPAGEEQNPDSKSALRDECAGNSSTGRSTKVIGLREGQWLRQWESTIKRAVTNRLQTSFTEPEAHDPPNGVAPLLDGYNDPQ